MEDDCDYDFNPLRASRASWELGGDELLVDGPQTGPRVCLVGLAVSGESYVEAVNEHPMCENGRSTGWPCGLSMALKFYDSYNIVNSFLTTPCLLSVYLSSLITPVRCR